MAKVRVRFGVLLVLHFDLLFSFIEFLMMRRYSLFCIINAM
jgi:hypothetical protein